MLKNNFQYSTDYDYEEEYSCEESGCYSEGICRCGRIFDAVVKSIDMDSLTISIHEQLVDTTSLQGKRDARISEIFYGGTEVDKYCINRILTHYKVWDPNNWSVDVEGGYYGDEIGDVSLNDTIFNLISKDCYNMIELVTLADKLKFVLTLEYGYLLSDIQVSDFELIEITKEQIDFKKLNTNHIQNVQNEDLSFYKLNYKLPRGIVRKSGDKYKIVDGFHRIISADDKKSFKVFAVK